MMKLNICKTDGINRITISGTTILEIDVNSGWWIPTIEYDGSVPPNEIDELVVTFRKSGREKKDVC